MISWLAKWFKRLVSDESGFIRIYRDRDKDDGGGGGDPDPNPDPDSGGGDSDPDPGSGDPDPDPDPGGEGDPDPDPDLEGIDDDKALAYLKSKGLDFESLEKLGKLKGNLGGVTTKHQDAMRIMKSLRAELGDEYDSTLARGMKKLGGQDDDDLGGGGLNEPEHFRNMTPQVKKQISDTYGYFMQRQLPGLIQSVVTGVIRHLDEKDFTADNPDYDDDRELYEATAKSYGITGRGKKSLALIKQKIDEDAKEALEALAGNEGGKGVKGRKGAPAPKGGDRGARDTEINWDDDKQVKAEYEKRKREAADKSRR